MGPGMPASSSTTLSSQRGDWRRRARAVRAGAEPAAATTPAAALAAADVVPTVPTCAASPLCVHERGPSREWWGDDRSLEARLPQLLKEGRAELARTLLLSKAEPAHGVTLFYLGVCAGILEGEAAAVEPYEASIAAMPGLGIAYGNLVRAYLARQRTGDLERALVLAKTLASSQPEAAEPQYVVGVVLMQLRRFSDAAGAYEATLRLDAAHRGAHVNGVHCLQQLPPDDEVARRRLEAVARGGVAAGLWANWMQRPPHLVKRLTSRPWWDKGEFAWCALLEELYPQIRDEVLRLRRKPASFTPVGGRAAHDHTLVAAGEWREYPLFGNGQKYAENCARCPVTAGTMERVSAAIGLAMAGGGETLFSTLRPGTHLRPHCGSTNTRLTAHLGIVIPPGCSIRAGNEWREWREGEVLVFDDSWEHEVRHRGGEDRVVLLINFWHPELAEHERRIELDTWGYQPI